MSDRLELAIKEWVDRFETRPVNNSKSIRLSSVSVTIHRITDFGSEWLWYITCDSPSHPEQGRWAWTGFATNTDPEGWSAHGISGGSGHPLNRGITWVNLGGQYSEDGLRLGGWVEDAGQHIDAVRLVDPSGLVLEDQVKNQVVLFRSHRPAIVPLTVELIGGGGLVAATHEFP